MLRAKQCQCNIVLAKGNDPLHPFYNVCRQNADFLQFGKMEKVAEQLRNTFESKKI